MADKAHNLTDKKLEQMERHLSAIYRRAQKEIQKTADEYFNRFKMLDEKKLDALRAGKITQDEYKSWRIGKVASGSRYQAMQKQISDQLLHVNQIATAYVNGELPEVYALNYNDLAGAVDGVGGYSFTLTDAETVRNLATSDETLLPYKYVDKKKDVRWNTKRVNAEVLQGVLQGDSMQKIAKRMENVTEMDRVSSIRNARTSVTGAENKGRMDSFKKAEADGIQLKKRWISTNDSRTRHAHQMLDGQERPIDKPFDTILQLSRHKSKPDKIMYPGDPAADPADVYNCRCTMAARVVGFGKVRMQEEPVREEQPAVKDKTVYKPFESGKAASEYFNKSEKYQKWEKGLTFEQENGISKYTGDDYESINSFLRGQMDKEDYDYYNRYVEYGYRLKSHVKYIDSAISKFRLDKDIKVYRTCEKDILDKLNVGDVFHDSGFSSTSAITDKLASGSVRMEIDVPKGKGRGAWVDNLSWKKGEEYEFLLARGTDFEVKEIKEKGKEVLVKLKVLGSEKDKFPF